MKKYIIQCSQVGIYSLLLLVLFMGSQLLVSLVFQWIRDDGFVQGHMYLLTLLSYSIVVGGIIWLNKLEGDSIVATYKGFTLHKALQAVKYTVPLWLLVAFINGLLHPFFPQYDVQVNTLFVSSEPILRFVVLVIGAPFIEEYLFRQKIQIHVKKHFGVVVAIIFQGILFGIIHPFGLQKIYASVLGIGLGFIKEKTGHILAPTIIHLIINGIGFIAGLLG